jgi:hypothetical protein
MNSFPVVTNSSREAALTVSRGHKMRNFRQQYDRVLRWYNRLKNQITDHQEYEDYIWAFFQNCWHLKDWIKNDEPLLKQIQKSGDEFEEELKKYPALMKCCGLANRSKHFQLDKKTTTKSKDANLLGDIMLELPSNIVRYDYFVTQDDGTGEPVLTVAEQAIKEWRTIFASCWEIQFEK